MTTIGPYNLLLAEIRSQALAWRRKGPAPARGNSAGERQEIAAAPRDWSADVARAVVAISPDDPQRNRKAFRAFLQAVLAKECGFRQQEEPAFQALVDQVQEAMELDPRLRQAMGTAGERLLEGAKG